MNTCILISRKIIESEIWEKPPIYIKVWLYLLVKAQHSNYKNLKRGQVFTSIPEIQDACTYTVGYRKEKPTKDQIFNVLQWLRTPTGKISRNSYEDSYEDNTKEPMITTTKATHGILVTICNYSFYQDIKNYGDNDEDNDENSTKALRRQRQANNINKNEKNDKNDKNGINIYEGMDPSLLEVVKAFEEMRTKMKKPMTDKAKELMLMKLQTLSGGDVQKGIAILEQSIERGWAGVFAIDGGYRGRTGANWMEADV